jgi:two-component system, LytTR family, sensor histidine kinase AlgZ
MHPILERGARLGSYLALWVLIGGLLASLLVAQARFTWPQAALIALPLAAGYGFVCLSAWYVSRATPLGAGAILRIAVTSLTAAVISAAGWLGLARAWTSLLARHGWLPAPEHMPSIHALVFGLGVLLYLLSLALSYLVAAFEQSRDAERRALQGQVLSRDAELRLLRAQIDPHFLFNSLHSISALTAADPPAARKMCVLLADFLRESLALGRADMIPLRRELDLVERFLAVERVRYGERLSSRTHAGEHTLECLVPALLLQPLVENAVTHGVAHVLAGGTIEVTAGRTGERLTIAVENPCDRDRPRRTGTGVGLANVRARLSALYGDAARVFAAEEQDKWRVELSLPAVESIQS